MSAIIGMPMPTGFLHKQETDVILLQEFATIEIGLIRGYNWYTNVGINTHGNAMLTRQTVTKRGNAMLNRQQ